LPVSTQAGLAAHRFCGPKFVKMNGAKKNIAAANRSSLPC
jgi:hypothetical protein